MVTEALSLDRIIRIRSTITPTQPLRTDFGRALLITSSTTIRPPNRTRVYSSLAGVAEDFDTTSTVYLDAQTYFSASPYPSNLVVGRWASVEEGAELVGAAPGTLAELQAVTAGTLIFGAVTISAIDLSAAATFADVATALQTAIQGGTGYGSATVTYTDGVFVMTVPNSAGAAAPATPIPTGTAATVIGFTDGTSVEGYLADTDIADALAEIKAVDSSWYWVAADRGIVSDTDLGALAAAVQADGSSQAGIDTVGAGILTANETTSLAASIANFGYDRVFTTWKLAREPLALAIIARMSSVDFSGDNTLVNPNGRNLPGISPDALASDIAGVNELERKRTNYYTVFGALARFRAGWTANPTVWMDSRYFLDWLTETIQLDLDNYLTQNPTRTPQTPLGQAGMIATVVSSLRKGVRNGGIAPGQISESIANDIRLATGNIDFDGYLTTGYLVYAAPFSTLSDAQIRARQAPSIRVWVKGSGAINEVDGDLVFEG